MRQILVIVVAIFLVTVIRDAIGEQLTVRTRSDTQDAANSASPFWAARGRRSLCPYDSEQDCDPRNEIGDEEALSQRREAREDRRERPSLGMEEKRLRSLGALFQAFLQGQQQHIKRQMTFDPKADPNVPFYPARG